jgi:hypothetical protein
VLHPDGTPYREREAEIIRELTGKVSAKLQLPVGGDGGFRAADQNRGANQEFVPAE